MWYTYFGKRLIFFAFMCFQFRFQHFGILESSFFTIQCFTHSSFSWWRQVFFFRFLFYSWRRNITVLFGLNISRWRYVTVDFRFDWFPWRWIVTVMPTPGMFKNKFLLGEKKDWTRNFLQKTDLLYIWSSFDQPLHPKKKYSEFWTERPPFWKIEEDTPRQYA